MFIRKNGRFGVMALALLASGIFFFSCEEAGDNMGGSGFGRAWPRTYDEVTFDEGVTGSVAFSGTLFCVVLNKSDECYGAMGGYEKVLSEDEQKALTGYTFHITKIFEKTTTENLLGAVKSAPQSVQEESLSITLDSTDDKKLSAESITLLNTKINAAYEGGATP